jgi:hypothetical protein
VSPCTGRMRDKRRAAPALSAKEFRELCLSGLLLAAESFEERGLGGDDCLLGRFDFVGLTNLQYPVEFDEFDFNFSKRFRFPLCIFVQAFSCLF